MPLDGQANQQEERQGELVDCLMTGRESKSHILALYAIWSDGNGL